MKISCIKQLLECLVTLQEKNIVHGDIKSENVIYNYESNQVKLIDFGNATKIEQLDNRIPRTTLPCRPPEMFLGRKETDFGVDMWSLGVLFFELYTKGSMPFKWKEEDEELTLRSIISQIGLPSPEYLDGCTYDRGRLSQVVPERIWKVHIWHAALLWKRPIIEYTQIIDFLGKIFRYENRLTAKEALQHELFQQDIDVKIECREIPRAEQKQMFLTHQEFKIPLTARCVHLPKSANHQYEIGIESKGVVSRKIVELHSGSTIPIADETI
jgi:serine/threonine protein kinase